MMIGRDGQMQHFPRYLLLKITSGFKNSPGYVFWLKKLKNNINIVLKATGNPIKQILSKFTMRYISVICGTIAE